MDLEAKGSNRTCESVFAGTQANVRQLLAARIKRLDIGDRKTRDAAVKAQLDRFRAELEKLPERWEFVERQKTSGGDGAIGRYPSVNSNARRCGRRKMRTISRRYEDGVF